MKIDLRHKAGYKLVICTECAHSRTVQPQTAVVTGPLHWCSRGKTVGRRGTCSVGWALAVDSNTSTKQNLVDRRATYIWLVPLHVSGKLQVPRHGWCCDTINLAAKAPTTNECTYWHARSSI